jgi:hypothetical protein
LNFSPAPPFQRGEYLESLGEFPRNSPPFEKGRRGGISGKASFKMLRGWKKRKTLEAGV